VGVSKEVGHLTKEMPQNTPPGLKTNRKIIFKKVKSVTGVTLYVLQHEADYKTALALLDRAGLELFTPQEIFHVMHGYFAIDDRYNIIPAKRNPDAQTRERMVLMRKGAQPLSFDIHPDHCVSDDTQWPRFCLHADNGSGDAASVVVGKRKR